MEGWKEAHYFLAQEGKKKKNKQTNHKSDFLQPSRYLIAATEPTEHKIQHGNQRCLQYGGEGKGNRPFYYS